jgi:acetate kinase
VGSLTAVLGGLDALLLSGGIGKNDAATRAEVMTEGCGWTGAMLDVDRNARGERRISTNASRVPVLVVPPSSGEAAFTWRRRSRPL